MQTTKKPWETPGLQRHPLSLSAQMGSVGGMVGNNGGTNPYGDTQGQPGAYSGDPNFANFTPGNGAAYFGGDYYSDFVVNYNLANATDTGSPGGYQNGPANVGGDPGYNNATNTTADDNPGI